MFKSIQTKINNLNKEPFLWYSHYGSPQASALPLSTLVDPIQWLVMFP